MIKIGQKTGFALLDKRQNSSSAFEWGNEKISLLIVETLRNCMNPSEFLMQIFQLSRIWQDSPGFRYAVLVSQIESICPGF